MVIKKLNNAESAYAIEKKVGFILEEDAEEFVVKLWRMLIFELLKVEKDLWFKLEKLTNLLKSNRNKYIKIYNFYFIFIYILINSQIFLLKLVLLVLFGFCFKKYFTTTKSVLGTLNRSWVVVFYI